MEVSEIIETANEQLQKALDVIDARNCFEIIPGSLLTHPDELDELASIEYDIKFTYGNCERKHSFNIGWNDLDGVGVERGEDGDVYEINAQRLLTMFYFDLALDDLDDEFIQ